VAATSPLPAGPGAELVYRHCSGCHALTTVLAAKGSDAAGWERILHSMEGYGLPLEPEERQRLLAYLTQRLSPEPQRGVAAGPAAPTGADLYARHCAGCHDGGKDAPPLAGRSDLKAHPAYVAQAVLFGVAGELMVNGRRYRGAMEPLPYLDGEAVARIVQFLTSADFDARAAAAERGRGWTPSLVRLFRPLP